jgi:hypothetical protein
MLAFLEKLTRKEVMLLKKKTDHKDPVNGVKFEEVDLSDPNQIATLHYRGDGYVAMIERNAKQSRFKKQASRGIWDDELRVVKVTQPKGKSFKVMGFTGEKGTTYLYPEEALWLLEMGQLELLDGQNQPITRQWLWERLFCSSDIVGLGPQHYSAFQHLRNHGYVARRWNRRAPTPEMSIADPASWNRMVEQEGGIENGWIVFEVWAPTETGNFKRSKPPKSHWRILPWSIESDFGAALAWSKGETADCLNVVFFLFFSLFF